MSTAKWFYLSGDATIGPLSAQELKELARSGRLKPTDRVRKDGMANWASAIQVKGLFEPQRPTTQAIPGFAAQAGPVLAPVPQSRDAPDPVFASAPAPGPLLGAPKYGQPIQGARSLKANIWRAVQLVTRKSKELKLAKISLPKAYAMLGQEVYRSNRFRPDLTDDYVRIDELQQKLKALSASESEVTTEKGSFSSKAKALARSTKSTARRAALMQELKAAERRLGEAAYRRSGEQSGPAGLVEPIWKLQNQLENLECEVSELGRSKPGAVITPWRLAAVAATVMLIATGWLLLGLRRSASQSAVGQPSTRVQEALDGLSKTADDIAQTATEVASDMRKRTPDAVADRTPLAAPRAEEEKPQKKPDRPNPPPINNAQAAMPPPLESFGPERLPTADDYTRHVQGEIEKLLKDVALYYSKTNWRDDNSSITGALIVPVQRLGKLGPDAKRTIPIIAHILQESNDPKTCIATAGALAEIGEAPPQVVAALKGKLGNPKHPEVQAEAALALVRLNVYEEEAGRVLLQVLPMPEWKKESRFGPREALIQLIPRFPALVPQIVEHAQGSSNVVGLDPLSRKAVLEMIAELGPVAKPAIPELLKILNSPGARNKIENYAEDDNIWRLYSEPAMRALGKVAPEQAIPMLLEMLNEADPQVRIRAAHLLSEMGPTARQAVPSLLPAVRVRSKEERVQNSSDYRCELSVHVLTGIGPEAKAAVPRLIEVVEKEPNIALRCRAAIALIRIGVADQELKRSVIPAVRDGLVLANVSPPSGLQAAMCAAGLLGPRARELTPLLMEFLKGTAVLASANNMLISGNSGRFLGFSDTVSNPDDRCLAAYVLGEVGPVARQANPLLLEYVADPAADEVKHSVRTYAAVALLKMGVQSNEAVSYLMSQVRLDKQGPPEDLARDANERMEFARRAIHGTFTDEAKAAVPHLVGALKDPEWRVRITAAYTLGQLGSVAKLASAQLQEAKAGEDKQVVVREIDSALARINR